MRTRLMTVITMLLLGTLTAVAGDREETERRLLSGWKLLQMDRKPAEAAEVFRSVGDDEEAPRDLRGEALLGLLRCERMLGRLDRVAILLRDLREKYADLPRVARGLPAFPADDGGPTTFLTGDRVQDGGDLSLDGIYGNHSGASFVDWLGGHASIEEEGPRPSPWHQAGARSISPGRWFRAPLRGGGVARCRWRPTRSSGVILEWFANPDAAWFSRRPVLRARPGETGTEIGHSVRIRLDSPKSLKAR